MKITATFTVEVDADKWADYNGITKAEVREDVKTHLLTAIQGSALLEEADAEVSRKN